jgi:hypothetical protein
MKSLFQLSLFSILFLLSFFPSFLSFIFSFQDRVSLCSPICPRTHSVDQAGLKLRDPPASTSPVLELKIGATTAKLLFLSFYFFIFFLFFFFYFQDRVSLYSPGCPGTHFVAQAGLKLRNLPASASQVLGLKAWATTTQLKLLFLNILPESSSAN